MAKGKESQAKESQKVGQKVGKVGKVASKDALAHNVSPSFFINTFFDFYYEEGSPKST